MTSGAAHRSFAELPSNPVGYLELLNTYFISFALESVEFC